MDTRDRLRQTIDEQVNRLRATVPTEREAVLLCPLTLLEHRRQGAPAPAPDWITGVRQPLLGTRLALWIGLDGTGEAPEGDPERWAASALELSATLAAADAVLDHVEAGAMRLVEGGPGWFDAWMATKALPVRWRERADVDGWAAHLAHRHAAELANVSALPGPARYQREARIRLAMMAYRLPYPPGTVLGGASVSTWRSIVEALIATSLADAAAGEPALIRSDAELAAIVANAAGVPATSAGQLLEALTVDRAGIAWHAVGPEVAPPPLLRVGGNRVAIFSFGMLSEPLLFLAGELRRRDPEGYHNAAAAREAAFRDDLYALFAERRYVMSPNRIVLRREDGHARTDIDAADFDRKTGTLALFELKSQDPFARTAAELGRQRDSFLDANRQVAGMLDWVNRHGADEVLNRMDRVTAKRFRVRKVVPFVLGRYLAAYPDGARPDRRAAWGSWPQVLRLVDALGAGPSNPLASLATRLSGDPPPLHASHDLPPRVLDLGAMHLTVWPSYAALRDSRA